MTIVPFLFRVIDLIINPLILMAFGLAFLYFVYGVFNFLNLDMSAVDKSRKEARDAIIWGIVGMVIMFSVFGIIEFVMDTFGITKTDISTETQPIIGL